MDIREKIYDDDFVTEIYNHRENKGGVITTEVRQELKNVDKEIDGYYEQIKDILMKYTKDQKELEKLKKLIKACGETFNFRDSISCERYYKVGLKDGVNLLIQILGE